MATIDAPIAEIELGFEEYLKSEKENKVNARGQHASERHARDDRSGYSSGSLR
jgi:hypothetical protein